MLTWHLLPPERSCQLHDKCSLGPSPLQPKLSTYIFWAVWQSGQHCQCRNTHGQFYKCNLLKTILTSHALQAVSLFLKAIGDRWWARTPRSCERKIRASSRQTWILWLVRHGLNMFTHPGPRCRIVGPLTPGTRANPNGFLLKIEKGQEQIRTKSLRRFLKRPDHYQWQLSGQKFCFNIQPGPQSGQISVMVY